MALGLTLRHDTSDAARKPEGALRCDCGSLLARLVPQGVEIKCRRCKRHVVLAIEGKAKGKLSM